MIFPSEVTTTDHFLISVHERARCSRLALDEHHGVVRVKRPLPEAKVGSFIKDIYLYPLIRDIRLSPHI